MFDRFLDFLNRLPGSERSGGMGGGDDPRVAAAALLTHIMDADGERTAGERDMLKKVLAETYDLKGEALDEIMTAGDEAHREAVDLYSFTSVLDRHLDREGRLEFIALMWDMVYSDGVLHELEDNLVWRVAELIHVERAERVGLRLAAQARAGIANGTAGRP